MATHGKHGKTSEQSSSEPKHEQGIERKTGAVSPARRPYVTGPFSLMRQFTEDMDRLFGAFFGPGLYKFTGWPEQPESIGSSQLAFRPEVDVNRIGNKLVVQADLPGLKKDDVHIDVGDDELVISGERRSESERGEGSYYQSERSYGRFRRTIPLPQGVKPEKASATFDNGVLKVEIEVPGEEEARGRRIEVKEKTSR